MFDKFFINRRLTQHEKRIRALEEAFSELGGDIAVIRTQFSSIRAKMAVNVREDKRAHVSKFDKAISEAFGGEVVAVEEGGKLLVRGDDD